MKFIFSLLFTTMCFLSFCQMTPSSISQLHVNDPSMTPEEVTETILNQTIEEIGTYVCTELSKNTIVFEKVLNEVNHAVQDSQIFIQLTSEFLQSDMSYSQNINFLFEYDEIFIYDINESVNVDTYEFITEIKKYPIASRMVDRMSKKFITIANAEGNHEFWNLDKQENRIIITRGNKAMTGFNKSSKY